MNKSLCPDEANEMLEMQDRTDAYEGVLRGFDWTYQFSEDQNVWKRAEQKLKWMRFEQRTVDRSGLLWLQHMPKGQGIPQPILEASHAS